MNGTEARTVYVVAYDTTIDGRTHTVYSRPQTTLEAAEAVMERAGDRLAAKGRDADADTLRVIEESV